MTKLKLATVLAMVSLLASCYSYQWNSKTNSELDVAPDLITQVFNKYPDGVIQLDASSPGSDYKYDIGEKDAWYSKEDVYRFTNIELRLQDKMAQGQVIADFKFMDEAGNVVNIDGVDLTRLTPKLDSKGEMLYAELLLEEFNRFGVKFRKEFKEFNIEKVDGEVDEVLDDNAYRASITNNCLAPGKWEFALTSTDFSDYNQRYKGDININQNKIFTHTWFYLTEELYTALLKFKNPEVDIDMTMAYPELSDRAEKNALVDFEQLRNPIKNSVDGKVVEIGHQSERKVEPLDVEEHYKWQFGLVLNEKEWTYKTILEETVSTAKFQDRGFYISEEPNVYDWSWMKHMDDIKMDVIDVSGSDSYVQLTLTGQYSPYTITLGNVDLALIDNQKLWGYLFGVNTYPKSRRYNPQQSTIAHDAELVPDEIKPFLLMTDTKTGLWVNNQYKGIEKIYLTYDTVERDVLNVYVLSYERIIPMWMGKVELPKEIRETVRIRKKLYSY